MRPPVGDLSVFVGLIGYLDSFAITVKFMMLQGSGNCQGKHRRLFLKSRALFSHGDFLRDYVPFLVDGKNEIEYNERKTKTKTNKQKENYFCFGWINQLIVCINGFRLDKLWSFLGKRGCLVYICLFCFLFAMFGRFSSVHRVQGIPRQLIYVSVF